uniref:Serine-threonine/tyrosine-protein kinase catalytic domain-containing protein n=1 Tax=Leersia perrieri TaxID=77586 RepID=A0A0D9WMA1_9ORYZ
MAIRGIHIFTTIANFLLMLTIALANESKSFISRSSSISPQDDITTILVSPNGDFSCGFYKVATNAFTFSIWFTRSSEKTVAWTATVKHTVDILKQKLSSEDQSWLLEFVDCRLDGEFNNTQATILLNIAVSCVEEDRRRRPTMSTVAEILLSHVE